MSRTHSTGTEVSSNVQTQRRTRAVAARVTTIVAAGLCFLSGAATFAGTGSSEPKVLHGHRSGVVDIAWHPDGSVLASAGSDNRVLIWRIGASSGPPDATLKGFKREALSAAFRPGKGEHLVVGDGSGRVLVFDTATWKRIKTLSRLGDRVDVLRFSPDATKLAVASGKRLTVFSVPDYKPVMKQEHEPFVVQLDWAPTSDAVITAALDGTAALWPLGVAEPKPAPIAHSTALSDVAFSPDGRVFATSDGHGLLRLWDRVTGEKLFEPLPATGIRAWALAWSPDGAFIASVGADGLLSIITAADGSILKRLDPGEGVLRKVAFSHDGRFVAAASTGKVHVWRTDSGAEVATFGGHREAISSLRWSPTGHRLASASDDDRVRVWDLGGM